MHVCLYGLSKSIISDRGLDVSKREKSGDRMKVNPPKDSRLNISQRQQIPGNRNYIDNQPGAMKASTINIFSNSTDIISFGRAARRKRVNARKVVKMVNNNNNVYFPVCEWPAQGKKKILHGWCRWKVNNENQSEYQAIYYVGVLRRRDENLQSSKQCTSMPDINLNRPNCVPKLCSVFWTVHEQRTASHFVFNCTKLRVSDAAPDRSSVADVEIWPEVPTSRALRDGQKS